MYMYPILHDRTWGSVQFYNYNFRMTIVLENLCFEKFLENRGRSFSVLDAKIRNFAIKRQVILKHQYCIYSCILNNHRCSCLDKDLPPDKIDMKW